jgi:hypothetical protein
MLLYLYDPSIGRYNEDLAQLSFGAYSLGTIIVCLSIIIIQLIINYFPVSENIKFSSNKGFTNTEPTQYFITPTILLLTIIISLNILLLLSAGKNAFADGGMQNYGVFGYKKILDLIDPYILILFTVSVLFTEKKLNINLLIYVIVLYSTASVLGGSKETALRLFYIFLAVLFVYNPNIKFKLTSWFFYGLLFFIFLILLFGLGHLFRMFFQWETNIIQASQTLPIVGSLDLKDFINFLLRRLDGLADFYVIVENYNEDVHKYFNFKNAVASLINFLTPGSISETLPSFLYFTVAFGHNTLDQIKIWYNSREISIFGLSYIYGYKYLFFIGPMIFGILLKNTYVFFNHPTRYIYLVFIFGTLGYIIRSLGIDDTIFRLIRGFLLVFILHYAFNKLSWKKISMSKLK